MHHLATRVVRGMIVHEQRMRENLDIICGALFAQRVEGGMVRDEAYRIVQDAAQHAWDERIALRELLAERPELELDLDAIFDLSDATRWAAEIVGRLPSP